MTPADDAKPESKEKLLRARLTPSEYAELADALGTDRPTEMIRIMIERELNRPGDRSYRYFPDVQERFSQAKLKDLVLDIYTYDFSNIISTSGWLWVQAREFLRWTNHFKHAEALALRARMKYETAILLPMYLNIDGDLVLDQDDFFAIRSVFRRFSLPDASDSTFSIMSYNGHHFKDIFNLFSDNDCFAQFPMSMGESNSTLRFSRHNTSDVFRDLAVLMYPQLYDVLPLLRLR